MRSVIHAVVVLALVGALQLDEARLRQLAASDLMAAPLATSEPTVSAAIEPIVLIEADSVSLTPEPAGCTFVLGFAELRELVGSEPVGDCLEDEQPGEDGDIIQTTTHGLLVWRALDNVGAF